MAKEVEEPTELRSKINRLRELIIGEEGLVVRTDDNFLLRYLRCSGYDPDIAFKRLKTYYGLKHQFPQWFAAPESSLFLDEAIEKGYFYILRTKDREGRNIYVNELGYIKESQSSMCQQSQLHDFYTEMLLDDETTQKLGLCVIVDLKNISWKLMKWLTPSNLQIAVKKTETLPVKRMIFHIVNPNFILNMALKVILPFLSNTTKENIYIHDSSWSSLHKMIDPENLPTSYGGMSDIDSLKIKNNQASERLKSNLRLGYIKCPDSFQSD